MVVGLLIDEPLTPYPERNDARVAELEARVARLEAYLHKSIYCCDVWTQHDFEAVKRGDAVLAEILDAAIVQGRDDEYR
jgi:hypothetical protein